MIIVFLLWSRKLMFFLPCWTIAFLFTYILINLYPSIGLTYSTVQITSCLSKHFCLDLSIPRLPVERNVTNSDADHLSLSISMVVKLLRGVKLAVAIASPSSFYSALNLIILGMVLKYIFYYFPSIFVSQKITEALPL